MVPGDPSALVAEALSLSDGRQSAPSAGTARLSTAGFSTGAPSVAPSFGTVGPGRAVLRVEGVGHGGGHGGPPYPAYNPPRVGLLPAASERTETSVTSSDAVSLLDTNVVGASLLELAGVRDLYGDDARRGLNFLADDQLRSTREQLQLFAETLSSAAAGGARERDLPSSGAVALARREGSPSNGQDPSANMSAAAAHQNVRRDSPGAPPLVPLLGGEPGSPRARDMLLDTAELASLGLARPREVAQAGEAGKQTARGSIVGSEHHVASRVLAANLGGEGGTRAHSKLLDKALSKSTRVLEQALSDDLHVSSGESLVVNEACGSEARRTDRMGMVPAPLMVGEHGAAGGQTTSGDETSVVTNPAGAVAGTGGGRAEAGPLAAAAEADLLGLQSGPQLPHPSLMAQQHSGGVVAAGRTIGTGAAAGQVGEGAQNLVFHQPEASQAHAELLAGAAPGTVRAGVGSGAFAGPGTHSLDYGAAPTDVGRDAGRGGLLGDSLGYVASSGADQSSLDPAPQSNAFGLAAGAAGETASSSAETASSCAEAGPAASPQPACAPSREHAPSPSRRVHAGSVSSTADDERLLDGAFAPQKLVTPRRASREGVDGSAKFPFPIPASFLCPLTSCIMVDPVTLTTGDTYERAAITEWLSKRNSNPVTCQELLDRTLRANNELRHCTNCWTGTERCSSL